jgi:hypothetical protein
MDIGTIIERKLSTASGTLVTADKFPVHNVGVVKCAFNLTEDCHLGCAACSLESTELTNKFQISCQRKDGVFNIGVLTV